MKSYTDEQVFLGTWGEIWFDGDFMAEVKKFRAEVEISYEDVPQCRKLGKGKKMTGYEGKGEVSLLKVSSYVTKRVSVALKAGKVPSFTIISKIADPNAIGAERIACHNCKFEKMTLADWEREKNGEENYSFFFSDWELLDTASE